MAETDLDMKVVQYVMGHANISVTMEVYNHITDRSRIEKEIAKMDLVQIMWLDFQSSNQRFLIALEWKSQKNQIFLLLMV